eukprot:gnl/Carplike_NY0171/2314_a3118_659.p1 GENE.gnl/Carplike_NY0171/2314_a3118_659~~gnl/Carplike_NY0171/2314_a3118_659.p1  ORF type:complete len:296 (+),score=47.54 gnl/Carplike_NY0171/2314_a3118_659:26-913(+)
MSLLASEIKILDRQVRTWGIEAQLKIKKSCVMIIGSSPFASEIMKNTVLACPKELVVGIYEEEITSDIIDQSFLLTKADIDSFKPGNTAQLFSDRIGQLSPFVKVFYAKLIIKDNEYYVSSTNCPHIKPDSFLSSSLCSFNLVIGCSILHGPQIHALFSLATVMSPDTTIYLGDMSRKLGFMFPLHTSTLSLLKKTEKERKDSLSEIEQRRLHRYTGKFPEIASTLLSLLESPHSIPPSSPALPFPALHFLPLSVSIGALCSVYAVNALSGSGDQLDGWFICDLEKDTAIIENWK